MHGLSHIGFCRCACLAPTARKLENSPRLRGPPFSLPAGTKFFNGEIKMTYQLTRWAFDVIDVIRGMMMVVRLEDDSPTLLFWIASGRRGSIFAVDGQDPLFH